MIRYLQSVSGTINVLNLNGHDIFTMAVKFAQTNSEISIFKAYFEADFTKNLCILESQIDKHYAYKNMPLPYFPIAYLRKCDV